MKHRILVVEDEDTPRGIIGEVLREDGHDVVETVSAEEGLRLFKYHPFPLVITDVVLSNMTGLELLEEIKVVSPDSLVVIMTSHLSIELAIEALRRGAYDFLTKPFDDIELISAAVHRATSQISLVLDNQDLMQRLKQNARELESLNARLLAMADRDGLTGLHNHRHFREVLDVELARCTRHGRAFSLILLDIDEFKSFNDAHGHQAGDSLLKSLAGVLIRGCRSSSVVARYGGEEFVVLLAETEGDGAMHYAKRLCETVAQQLFKDENGKHLGQVTISIGVASYPEDGTDANTLIECAARTLYLAKQAGCNTVRSTDGAEREKKAPVGSG